jgi:putative redox protein
MPTISVLARSNTDGMRVEATTESGYTIGFDRSEAEEVRSGPGPTEVVLAALAACTAMDVTSILAKKRQAVRDYQIAVTGERAERHPRVFTRIVIEHQVVGEVEVEALRRSIELSATRYCPVSAMLSKAATLEHRYRLWQASQEGEGLTARVAVTGPDGARIE